jgi:hypothetical protein
MKLLPDTVRRPRWRTVVLTVGTLALVVTSVLVVAQGVDGSDLAAQLRAEGLAPEAIGGQAARPGGGARVPDGDDEAATNGPRVSEPSEADELPLALRPGPPPPVPPALLPGGLPPTPPAAITPDPAPVFTPTPPPVLTPGARRAQGPSRAQPCTPTGPPKVTLPVIEGPSGDGGRWVTVAQLSGNCGGQSAPFRLSGQRDTRVVYRSDAAQFLGFIDDIDEPDAAADYAAVDCGTPCADMQDLTDGAGSYRIRVSATDAPWELLVQEYQHG